VTLINFGKITANLKLNLSAKTTASHGVPKNFADSRNVFSIEVKHFVRVASYAHAPDGAFGSSGRP
jgi:hypothetical protein